MIDNHNYDVVKALTKKSDAILAYDQYLQDSKGCEECQAFWRKLKAEDNRHVEELKDLSATHLKAA